MRLIELALLYLLDRIKQNANSDVLRYVSSTNTTHIDPTARGQDGNIVNAFLIMDFHRYDARRYPTAVVKLSRPKMTY